jgi:hypothetical protein
MNNEQKSTSPQNGRWGQGKEKEVATSVCPKNTRNHLANQVGELSRDNHLRFMLAAVYGEGFIEVRFDQTDEPLISAWEHFCINQNKPSIFVRLCRRGGLADLLIDWSTCADKRVYLSHSADAVQLLRPFARWDSVLGDNMITNLRLDKARDVARLMVAKISEWIDATD